MPRPYGNRRSVLAWSGWVRHLTYATSCRTSSLITSERLLDNMTSFQLEGEQDGHDILSESEQRQGDVCEQTPLGS
jgi:hypothetical protein